MPTPATAAIANDYLSLSAAAAEVGIGRHALLALTAAKAISAQNVAGRLFYAVADLKQLRELIATGCPGHSAGPDQGDQ